MNMKYPIKMAATISTAVALTVGPLFVIASFANTNEVMIVPIKIPVQQSEILKKIIDRQDALSKEFQLLDQQKIIIIQRVALENNITAKQFDELELVATNEGYVLQPKPKPTTQSKK